MATSTIERSAKGMFDIRFPEGAVADLNNPPSSYPSLYITDGDTLNTPYKTGQVGGSAGFAFSYLNSANFGIQLYFVSGNSTKLLIRQKASGTWGAWRTITSTS